MTVHSPSPLLSVQGVDAHYGSVQALHGIDIDIREGESFAILGPSGSGKSTLLRLIAGFEPVSAGTVTLDGRDLAAVPAHRRPIGLMFQSYALFPHMSASANIAYGLRAEGVSRAETRRRTAEALETIGLASVADRRPARLSGGQRQRIALARALVKRPRMLLLDEPLSALDRRVRADMQAELKRLQHETGMTFVIVTHDQEEAMVLADRIALLRDGAIEQIGTPTQMYERPATAYVARFIGTSTLVPGVVRDNGLEVPGIGLVGHVDRNGWADGDRAALVLRPEHVELVPADTAAWRGRFVSASYLGGHVDALIETPHGEVTVRVPRLPELGWGEEIGLRITSSGRHLVPADDEIRTSHAA